MMEICPNNLNRNNLCVLASGAIDHATLNQMPAIAFVVGIVKENFIEHIKVQFVNDSLLCALAYDRDEIDLPGFCFLSNMVHEEDAQTIAGTIELFNHAKRNHVEKTFMKLKTHEGKAITITGEYQVTQWNKSNMPVQFMFTGMVADGNLSVESAFDLWSKEQKRIRYKDKYDPLTEREMQVHDLCIQAKRAETIAEKLEISVDCVKQHKSNIFGKLNVENSYEMILLAVKCGRI